MIQTLMISPANTDEPTIEEISLLKTKAKKAQKPQIVEREHGRYMIKAGLLQNAIVARAFPKPPSKYRHLVAEATGPTAEAAIDQLIEKLEALRSERRSLRRIDPKLGTGVPTREEYADAFRSLSPSPKLLGVLHDHALSRRRGIPLKELVGVGEFLSVQELITAYERLGRDIFTVIEPDEIPEAAIQAVLILPEDHGLPPANAIALQPELQDAILHLLGTERKSK